MRANVTAHELVERAPLMRLAFLGALYMLLNDSPPPAGPSESAAKQIGTSASAFGQFRAEFLATGAARHEVEGRYFDGRDVLFPAVGRSWEREAGELDAQLDLTRRWCQIHGVRLPDGLDEASDGPGIRRLVDDLIEPARVQTLEKVDEHDRAARLATAWVRSKRDEGSAA